MLYEGRGWGVGGRRNTCVSAEDEREDAMMRCGLCSVSAASYKPCKNQICSTYSFGAPPPPGVSTHASSLHVPAFESTVQSTPLPKIMDLTPPDVRVYCPQFPPFMEHLKRQSLLPQRPHSFPPKLLHPALQAPSSQ